MRLLLSLLMFSVFAAFNCTVYAQVCNGSLGAPVVNETFGKGSTYGPGPALPYGVTNLRYFLSDCGGPDDSGEGVYTLQTFMGSSCKGGSWQSIPHDHTGDANGYMMIVNAGQQPDVFFNENVAGNKLCANTTYFFGAYIMNILRDLPGTQGFIEPNIIFRIETADGRVLKVDSTGRIKASKTEGQWIQYGTLFTTPADGSDIVVKMINKAPGGNGNDFALDDITFSPCGPLIKNGFGTIGDNAPRSSCRGENLQYTLVASQTGYDDPAYQWQQNLNDGSGWTDRPGQTDTSTIVTISNSPAGKYQYRIGVLNKSQAGSEACRIYSDPLTIDVFAQPAIALSTTTSACRGGLLQLSSTGGDTYAWTGPNGFTANTPDPVISRNADPSFNGDYTVQVTRNGCSSSATTTVTVYEPATVAPMAPLQVCRDVGVQLSPVTANATRFKWTPSAGLDHDDIKNPIATPAATTTYSLEVSNEGGCPNTAEVVVKVLQLPVASAGPDKKIMEGESVKLNGSVQGDSIVQAYWTPPDFLDDAQSLTPTTSATDNITYTLHVVSGSCGESSDEVFVRVYKKVTAPNTFTPNNDGVNDTWVIKNILSYPKATVNVYDRYGQHVYQSRGYPKPWDGSSGGKPLNSGTYYYVIALNEDDLPPVAGWVLLVR